MYARYWIHKNCTTWILFQLRCTRISVLVHPYGFQIPYARVDQYFHTLIPFADSLWKNLHLSVFFFPNTSAFKTNASWYWNKYIWGDCSYDYFAGAAPSWIFLLCFFFPFNCPSKQPNVRCDSDDEGYGRSLICDETRLQRMVQQWPYKVAKGFKFKIIIWQILNTLW